MRNSTRTALSTIWLPGHFLLMLLFFILPSATDAQTNFSAEQVAADFTALLKRPLVDARPSFKSSLKGLVEIQHGSFYSEKDEKVPVLIYKPVESGAKKLPVVICLHGTGGTKDGKEITDFLIRLSGAGFMAVAIDARFHGERISGGANGSKQYVDAIITAWQNKDEQKQTHPFLYDTVYDIWRLTDYLAGRPDVDAGRIGMTGISMGGIETWMAASVDKRIKVVVPIIAAQSFKWSLENDRWQGRAHTIQAAHEQAVKDLGDTSLNKRNVKLVWDKVVPGITGEFDCPSMIRLIAPRPLLLLSNEKDQNCPFPGADIAFKAARTAYHEAVVQPELHVSPNEPHRLLPVHVDMAIAWFKKWL